MSQQPDYPALFDLGNRQLHPLRGRTAFLVGRSETADLTVLDVRCSRQQFRLVRDKGHYHEAATRLLKRAAVALETRCTAAPSAISKAA